MGKLDKDLKLVPTSVSAVGCLTPMLLKVELWLMEPPALLTVKYLT